jgi:hypothetical protein
MRKKGRAAYTRCTGSMIHDRAFDQFLMAAVTPKSHFNKRASYVTGVLAVM